jgi:hypothetical protein
MSFKQWLEEKYSTLSGGGNGHYGHASDNAFHGSGAMGAAANLFGNLQARSDRKSTLDAQKKTDGSVSVVTVRNSKDSKFHNPAHPQSAVGVAYKGRVDSKTIAPSERVAYSRADVEKHYDSGHHLTPVLSKLLDSAHKIHGTAAVIQHDIHTTDPERDLHHEPGKTHWQPNTIRNSTTDPTEIKKLKAAKIVLASHTGFDKNYEHPHGLSKTDVRSHDDVYNVNLTAPKVSSTVLAQHNKTLGAHMQSPETRRHLDRVASASYNDRLERFTNSKINRGEYGGKDHPPLEHSEFKKFVGGEHDRGIAKVSTAKAKAEKTSKRDLELDTIDSHHSSLKKVFAVHHDMTSATRDFVHHTLAADGSSPIKHELPDGKGGFEPASFEGIVARGKHEKVNTQKFNDRGEFNRANKAYGEERFGKKAVKESTEGEHAVIVPAARMQPPTLAHDVLIGDTVDRAKRLGGKAHVFITSAKAGDEKSPLTLAHRINMLNHAYADHVSSGHLQFHTGSGMHKNLSDFNRDHPQVKHAHVVLGDDRMSEAGSLKSYNGVKNKAGEVPYNFKSLSVEARKKTNTTHDSIRATELRAQARSGDSPIKNLSVL